VIILTAHAGCNPLVDSPGACAYHACRLPAASSDLLMNVPNSLTILRILLIPVFVGLLIYEEYGYSLGVLLIAALTDALDGTIARVANQRTRLGAILDPLADKLLLTAGFIALSVQHLVPLWVAILVVSRDMILMTGALLIRVTDSEIDLSPTLLGKGTTVLQVVYMIMVVVWASQGRDVRMLEPLLFTMVGLTVISGFHYLYRGIVHLSTSQA
jgi:cardiolipin synthase